MKIPKTKSVALAIGFACLAPLIGSAGAPGFPKPHPERFFADDKILQPDGSIYRVPIEDWEGARKRVAGDPAWAKWIADKRAAIDDWMTRRADRAEWIGGRGHDFVSPRDGAFLVWTPDIPGEEVKTLKSRTGDEVAVTKKIFEGWVDKFRKRHMEMIAEAGRFYRLTGDSRYADWVASQLDFYGDNLAAGAWPVAKGRTGRLGVMPFNDGVMLTQLTEAARLIFDSPAAPPARRQAWMDKLFRPECELLDRAARSIHNHTLWERAAMAQAAMLYQDDALLARALEGEHGLRDLFARGVTSEWFWFEQSMQYHDFVMMGMQPLLVFAGLTGQAGRIRNEAAIMQNMMFATLQIRFPDNTVPNPADSVNTARAPSGRLGANYRTLPTTLGLAMAAAAKPNWQKLLDPPGNITGTPAPPASDSLPALPGVVSQNFDTTRFALLKKDRWQVFFHYGQVGRPHSQSEALNWSACLDGVRITADPGNVGYGSKRFLEYYTRGLHHNVPLIGGEGQQSWNPGQLLRFDPEAGVMSAAQPAYRQNASASRTLRIEGDALIDETTVTLHTIPAPETRLGLALHLHGRPLPADAAADAGAARFGPVMGEAFHQGPGRPPAFRYWKNVRSASLRDRATIDVEFSPALRLRVEFVLKGGGEFTLYQGDSPDLPPRTRAGFYLEQNTPSATATFQTILHPMR